MSNKMHYLIGSSILRIFIGLHILLKGMKYGDLMLFIHLKNALKLMVLLLYIFLVTHSYILSLFL